MGSSNKYSMVIIRKIIEISSTRFHILGKKCTKSNGGCAPESVGGSLQHSSRPSSWIYPAGLGPNYKGRGGEKGKGGEDVGKGGNWLKGNVGEGEKGRKYWGFFIGFGGWTPLATD